MILDSGLFFGLFFYKSTSHLRLLFPPPSREESLRTKRNDISNKDRGIYHFQCGKVFNYILAAI